MGDAALRLARSFSNYWSLQCVLDSVVVSLLPQAQGAFHTYSPRTAAYLSGRSRGSGTVSALAPIIQLSSNLGILGRQVSHRSDLVVLFVLATIVLWREIQSEPFASRAAAYRRL